VTIARNWTGRETRLLREALRMSVRGFAEYLGIPARTVSKWEQHGASRVPRPEFQAMLDTVLARATPDEYERSHALAAGTPVAAPAARSPGSASPDLLTGAANPDPPTIGVGDLRSLAQAVLAASDRDEPELVPYFETQLRHCQNLDGATGPGHALPSTLGLVAAIETRARSVGRQTRQRLLCLAARGSEFVGWLYRDAGAFGQATYWYDRGSEWAQEAGSPPLQGYILLRRSQMAYDLRDGLRVLSLAEATDADVWQLPVRIRAEAVQQRALGLAMTGEGPHSVERTLDDARSLLTAAPEVDDLTDHLLGASFTEATLSLRSAASYVEADRPAVAVDLLAGVLTEEALSTRDAGYFRARQAIALAACREPDAAAEVALTAAETVTATNSFRTRRALDEAAARLDTWSERPSVRRLREAVGA
jgi:transcriptional regulator with XRE-family HTH domain